MKYSFNYHHHLPGSELEFWAPLTGFGAFISSLVISLIPLVRVRGKGDGIREVAAIIVVTPDLQRLDDVAGKPN